MEHDGTWSLVILAGAPIAIGRLDTRWSVVVHRSGRTGQTFEQAYLAATGH